jgi:hypothetical protein
VATFIRIFSKVKEAQSSIQQRYKQYDEGGTKEVPQIHNPNDMKKR